MHTPDQAKDDTLRMAREVGFEVHERKQQARVGVDALLGIDSTDKLLRFAALVAAAERESCAKTCNAMVERRGATDDHKYMADTCAVAIRARQANSFIS